MERMTTETDFDNYMATLPTWARQTIEAMAFENAQDTVYVDKSAPAREMWSVAIRTAEMIWDDPASFGLELK